MKKPSKYRLLLRTLVILIPLIGVLAYGTSAATREPSVIYIEGNQKQFFIASKLTFDRSNATHVLLGLSRCMCKTACFARGPTKCQAWSFVRVSRQGPGEIGECRHIDSGPETTELLPDYNAIYYFRKSSVSGTYSFQDDKLLYVALKDTYFSDAARERCRRIPGHRLIIVKSNKTYHFFTSLSKDKNRRSWLTDLRKFPNGSFVWGDGSDPSVTQGDIKTNENATANVFISYSGRIDDTPDSKAGPFSILCQANPLGIDW